MTQNDWRSLKESYRNKKAVAVLESKLQQLRHIHDIVTSEEKRWELKYEIMDVQTQLALLKNNVYRLFREPAVRG